MSEGPHKFRSSTSATVQELIKVTQTFVPWEQCSKFISSCAKSPDGNTINALLSTLLSCHVMPRYVTSCHVMSYLVMSRHVSLCHVTSCHVMSRHATLCHVISRQVTSRQVMSRHVTSKVAGRSHDQRFIFNWLFSHANSFKLGITVFVGCPEGCRYHTASAVYNLVLAGNP